MKVVYLIQTHSNPEQIYRLVRIIKKSSPESYVVVSHDFIACDLDVTPLKIPGVEVLRLRTKGRRGDFSMVQGYLDAVNWLLSHQIDFDWLFNITGQDYPTQPLPQIENFLAQTEYDGFLEYFEALSDDRSNPWGAREGCDRYLYQYWRSGVYVSGSSPLGKILNRIVLAFNQSQPLIRLGWVFDGLMVGSRANSTPFNENFLCYGGSYFHTVSKKCVEFLYNFSQQHPQVVEYYEKTCVPVESFIQTVLVNSRLFNLCNNSKRYTDFSDSKYGSPKTLTIEDYPVLIKDDIHFARKFDLAREPKILDLLDARILQVS